MEDCKGNMNIDTPPKGLAIALLVGPSFVWAAEFIGSGEVILATRTGAILGSSVLWAIVVGIFLKYWIGMSGGRYTVCTGEGMVDMFDRIPGPRHWVVWIVMVIQFGAGVVSIGSLATAAGVFLANLTHIRADVCGWAVTVAAVAIAWTGKFDVLKIVMSFFVLVIVSGALFVAAHVFPSANEFLYSLTFHLPKVPDWARQIKGVSSDSWRQLLPVMGWGAGGFASQVWYTYWVIGAGYGASKGRGYGRGADMSALKNMSAEAAMKIKGWCHVLYADATLAMIIGVAVTGAFFIAGAGILGAAKIAPDGADVAIQLSYIFGRDWGNTGRVIFMITGAAALIATQIGQLAGWPRLLADSFRLCFPAINRRYSWKTQFRFFLVFFFATNLIIVSCFKNSPVILLIFSSVLDGLLLTPFQALWIAVAMFFVMPKMLSPEAMKTLKPHWIFAVGLVAACALFGYICIFQIPRAMMSVFGAN
jgi:Mn2+/Fe2+ NRAMP family transporter